MRFAADSRPAVTVRLRLSALTWCNSMTDSRVWMKEEIPAVTVCAGPGLSASLI